MSQKGQGMVGRNSNYSGLVSHWHYYLKHYLTTYLIYFSNPNGKFSKYQNNDWNTLYWGRHGQRGEISCNILSIQMLIKPSTVKGTVLNI